MSVEFVSNMERGVNAPSFETLEKLAVALGVAVEELFSLKEN
jgi:transcriptional regulator with XRE-family HTH domain